MTRAYQLADGKPVDIKGENGKVILSIARPILDPMATVIVVEHEGASVQR